jgi:uncharacterized protein with ParB-like and HNH nuclease domain
MTKIEKIQNYYMCSHEVIPKFVKKKKKKKPDYTLVINKTECNKLNDTETNLDS